MYYVKTSFFFTSFALLVQCTMYMRCNEGEHHVRFQQLDGISLAKRCQVVILNVIKNLSNRLSHFS
jgi:hypothetical protein